ncbi:MAG: hypothetical protein AB7F86_14705 [Bdellovibrionales bacterium]
MSHADGNNPRIITSSPRVFFFDKLEAACRRLKFEPLVHSKNYLVELLEHYMVSGNLFTKDPDGKHRRETLAELYLRAQNSPTPTRRELYKRLGDSSLYISGFFGDSITRQLVDLDYYVEMGGTAYGSLSADAADDDLSQMYREFSLKFVEFVDVLTFMSQDVQVQNDQDLLRLYDRYVTTGSKLAQEQLVEKGLLNADLPKVKAIKM